MDAVVMMPDQARVEALTEVIMARRSIRAYKPDPIPPGHIKRILEACIWAPNGENYQPWRFVVTQDKEKIRQIGLLCARSSGRRFLQEYLRGDLEKRLAAIPEEKRKRVIQKMVEGRVSGFVGLAPLLITFLTSLTEGIDNVLDIGAAAENGILMATALGIGSCWVIAPCKDPRDEQKVRQILGVPDGYCAKFLVSFGFPDESPRPRPRRPLSEVAFAEQFGLPFEA